MSRKLLIAELCEGGGICESSKGQGIVRVQNVRRLEIGQKLPCLLLVQELHRLIDMGENEPVHADHDRSSDLRIFGDLIGLEGGIHCFLHILHIDLQPSHVASSDGVLLVVPDVQGSPNGAVGHGHHNGKPHA